MENWKDVPNLFCNGKFKIKDKNNNNGVAVGYDFEQSQFLAMPLRRMGRSEYYSYMDISDCTLIARKIESLSDEEIQVVKSLDGYFVYQENDDNEDVRRYLSTYWASLTAQELLYLLSIGCYPFSQSHFKTGSVIDSKTIKQ